MNHEVSHRLAEVETLLRVAHERLTECYDLGASQEEANIIEAEVETILAVALRLQRVSRRDARPHPARKFLPHQANACAQGILKPKATV